MLTIVSEEEPVFDAIGHSMRLFHCQCDCGKEIYVYYHILMANRKQSCGCTKIAHRQPVDLTGEKIRMLTVISEAEPLIRKNGSTARRWNCVCECGNRTTVLHESLIDPLGTMSCGCMRSRGVRRTIPDLVGNRYGKLTVLKMAGYFLKKDHSKRPAWLCLCDCGNEKIVLEANLVHGRTRSCGCLKGKGIKGMRFGSLTVLERAPMPHSLFRYYKCRCDCGTEIVVSQKDLDWGTVTNCGCQKRNIPRLDLTGQRFGRLTPLREVAPFIAPNGKAERAWLCRCTCGKETVVRQKNLTGKITQSCGCLRSKRDPQSFVSEEILL